MRVPLLDQNGVVMQVVELLPGAAWTLPGGLTQGPEGGNIGDTWTGSAYQKPWAHTITADHVRSEAQRRIMAMMGVDDLNACLVKQLNANMRANELNAVRHDRAWTTEEAAEVAALTALATAIKAIRAASNAMEGSPPWDYEDDEHWP